jgi:hypothetical protein
MVNKLISLQEAADDLDRLQSAHMVIIADAAAHIKKSIMGGKVYGVPVNPKSDLETLLVAAYFLGQEEERKALNVSIGRTHR